MIQSKHLQKIQDIIFNKQDLGLAIVELSAFCQSNDFVSINEPLEVLANEYALMKDYMRRGYPDAMRGTLYNKLVKRAYVLLSNAKVDVARHKDSLYGFVKGEFGKGEFEAEAIKNGLESFVQSSAMLFLEEPLQKEIMQKELYKAHYDYLSNLFNAIVASYQWSEELASFITTLLISPTIEQADARLLVSAITLSNLQFFDYNKFMLLIKVIENATDEELKQRAFVGFALTMPNNVEQVYTNLPDEIANFLTPERAEELAELQIQVFYCKNADADTQEIQQNIMPHLANQSGLKIKGSGMLEVDETSLDSLENFTDSNKNLEKVEESMRKMMDMQRAGSDVYFGGFAQMKRFSFFYRFMNWFCDFNLNHPDLEAVMKNIKDNKLFDMLLNQGPFCDSDKYSFALSLSQVFSSLPENMKEAMKNGEGMGQFMTTGDENTSPYKRRMYLQNLYRFFRLSTNRTSFYNPFDYQSSLKQSFFSINSLLFFSNYYNYIDRVMMFLIKKKEYDMVNTILKVGQGEYNPNIYPMIGAMYLRQSKYQEALVNFMLVQNKNIENKQVLEGLAQAWLGLEVYDNANSIYEKLLNLEPHNKKYLLNHAIIQIYLEETEKAMPILQKLNYENEHDLNVKRALAWCYLWQAKPNEAEMLYDKIIETGKSLPSDYLNIAYAKWFQNNVAETILFFKRYLEKQNKSDEASKEQLNNCFENDNKLLEAYKISTEEERIMIDLVLEF